MNFEAGQTYHAAIGPGLPYKIHICAVIDNEMVVYRYYGRHKQWWHYVVEHHEMVAIKIERGKG